MTFSKKLTSQLNLPHGRKKEKVGKKKKTRKQKRICSEVSVNSPVNPWKERKARVGRKGLQKRKVLGA